MREVIIIGGGPSGIVSAIFSKNNNTNVTILERNNKVLKKLLMTGNGKCNYLNESYNISNYFSKDIDIVDKIISTNNIERVKEFFDSLGIIPKIKNGYYYPYSNQATTIRDVLVDKALELGINIETNVLVENISKENNKFIINTNNKTYESDILVIGTGSYAYPKTGSDGLGYSFLNDHEIVECVPALVPLISNNKYLKIWDGVRSDVELELFEDNKYLTKEIGEVQLTNYGISGICTFNLSHIVSRGLLEARKELIKINFVPFIKDLISPWMDTYSKKNVNKNISKLLEGFLNKKIVEVIIKELNIKEDIYYKDLSNEQKLSLCKLLRSYPVEIIGTKDYDSSQTTNGGIKLTEINPNTLESNKVSNLYIVGEILDINGKCGGYNLTTCWITAMLAGDDINAKNK